LDNLTFIGGELSINSNPLLSNCEAEGICAYLSDPNGTISIYGNSAGCSSLIQVAVACGTAMPCLEQGTYRLYSQFDVDHFPTVFPGCTNILCNFYIGGDDITNLDSLEVIISIEGGLSIGGYNGGNPALTSLTGLEGLTSVGGYLYIYDNYALNSLTGLDNLASIGGYLDISLNYALTSLTGLDNIDAGSITDLNIFYNNSLFTCEVQSICDYLASPNGTVSIYNNAPGCNSMEEVVLACETVGVDESAVSGQRSAVNIYPNPTSTSITISTPTTNCKNTFITIIDITGKQLISRQITEQQTVVDVSGLPQGIYFVRVTDESKVQVGKFVKQ
jgi:hypothetical protein